MNMVEYYAAEQLALDAQRAKFGDYNNPPDGCPYCERHRVMIGDDEKHRCEKCGWCIEDEAFDYDFIDYLM